MKHVVKFFNGARFVPSFTINHLQHKQNINVCQAMFNHLAVTYN